VNKRAVPSTDELRDQVRRRQGEGGENSLMPQILLVDEVVSMGTHLGVQQVETVQPEEGRETRKQ